MLHVMIGSVDTDTIQQMIPHDDDTRSVQHSEQGHNKKQGAASTEQPVAACAAEVTAQSSGNETDHSTTHSSQNEGIF